MYVCENCFDSSVINEHIIKVGYVLRADFICKECNNRSTYRIDKNEFIATIRKIIERHYEHEYQHSLIYRASQLVEEGDDMSLYLSSRIVHSLRDICDDFFGVYEDKFFELLTNNYSYYDSGYYDDSYSDVWINMGRDWDGSSKIELRWDEFCENVKHKARFFEHAQFNRSKELSKLNETFLTLSINVSTTLYRARNANKDETLDKIHLRPVIELGIAPPQRAGHNRFSPSGIPYVYLSEDDKTIIKEIRANDGDRVGIGRFQINNLNLVDLRKDNLEKISKDLFNEKCTAQLLCSASTILDFLSDITKEVKKEDNHLEYIPTQIVSEYIWSLGYDGFIFDSSLCSGTNYVLFKDTYGFVDYRICEI